jgi:hypothetical protein
MSDRLLRQIGLVVFVLILAIMVPPYLTNLRVKDDRTSALRLEAAKTEAQPLVDALAKYRADHGLYPPTLEQVTPAYLRASFGADRFRYAARRPDWTLKSGGCAAREKSLHGLIMKEAAEYRKEVAAFKADCITGFRDYQLQTPDFPRSDQSPGIERWGYYDSWTKKWSLGWCDHARVVRGEVHESAMNGVCRWQDDLTPSDPW